MIITKTLKDTRQLLDRQGSFSNAIAFVPTMGALHEGHLELVKTARQMAKTVVASIFVNPTQFNDPADFAKYPKSLEQDILMLESAGADLLFLPQMSTIYPDGTALLEHYELGRLDQVLEGKFRPGHFQGVCQVVNRLLAIVQPGILCMGQKDYQQCMVVQRMIEMAKLPVIMQVVPTIREKDGLAMSSRNRRLTPEQRRKAVAIYEALKLLADGAYSYELEELEEKAKKVLLQAGFDQIDYATVADARTLEPVTHSTKGQPLVALVAAVIGGVRLIDNMPVSAETL